MSFRSGRVQGLKGIPFADQSQEKRSGLFRDVLNNGLHGLCYSAYEEDQKPGSVLTEDQIRRRMAIIAPYISWIRSFSCMEGNELIPVVAREFGLKTLVGLRRSVRS